MTDKQTDQPQANRAGHYFADWWVYVVLAGFICGLVFLTYALTLRGDVISDFGKPGTKTAPPADTAAAPAAPASTPAR
jgi:hypothetical protein